MENAKHRLRSLFDGLTPRLRDFGNKKPNEANTKALVIEPILKALGWNLLDLDEVEREFRVFDNTLIDYSLRLPPSEAPGWDEKMMRDVTKIGHFGMGDTELVLTRSEQIPKAIELARLAYERQGT